MFEIYPLRFESIMKEVLWGGTRLSSLGKRLPPGRTTVGESWELVDLPDLSGRIADGPLRGLSLNQLLSSWAPQVLGKIAPAGGCFPLLVKFIDARERLSVQVHPDEGACRKLRLQEEKCRPKGEAWYVVDADEGAELYLGLADGVSPDRLQRALESGEEGTIGRLFRRVPAPKGSFFHVPAGMVHAIGAGLLICEVQQASDTTFRMWDWNRQGEDGQPRPLHIQEALQSIRFPAAQPAHRSTSGGPPLGGEADRPWNPGGKAGRKRVVTPAFSMELVQGARTFASDGLPVVLVGLEGGATVEVTSVAAGAGLPQNITKVPLDPGTTLLLPAAATSFSVTPWEGGEGTNSISCPADPVPVSYLAILPIAD